MRVSEITDYLNATWEGAGDVEISGAAALESASAHEIAFVGNRKALASAAETHAGCLLVSADFPSGRTLIRAMEPRAAFARVIGLLHSTQRTRPAARCTKILESLALLSLCRINQY